MILADYEGSDHFRKKIAGFVICNIATFISHTNLVPKKALYCFSDNKFKTVHQ